MIRQEVVAAVILDGVLVLCAQRGPDGRLPGKWEFPGGKVEAGEEPRIALRREIREELGCTVRVGAEIVSTVHVGGPGSIRLTTYLCEIIAGEPEALEHAELRWVERADLGGLDWAEPDLPTVELLRDGII